MSLLAIMTNGNIGLGLVALAFIAFAVVSSVVLPRRNPDFPGSKLGAYLAVAALLFVAMLAAVVVFAKEGGTAAEGAAVSTETQGGGRGGEPTTTEGAPATTGGGSGTAGDATAGKAVFASAGCGGCHTLAAAGSSGTIGPNLDEAGPSADRVVQRVTNGKGVMPSFKDSLSTKQIADVAAYVSSSVGG